MTNQLTLQRYKGTNKCLHEDLGNGTVLTMVLIPAGDFLMGAPESEPESLNSERPQHRVTFAAPFLMGRYPVTQAQWRQVASYPQQERELELDPSNFTGDNRPVEQVNWEDAVEFCKRLSTRTGRTYRLPSEAEWEYACRAGTTTPFHFGDILSADIANYWASNTYNGSPEGKRRDETTEVGDFPANRWGLCDMHGNVWEWCEDDIHETYDGAPTDGSAWLDNEKREDALKVLRGGSWLNNPVSCRSASRNGLTRASFNDNVGFRVVCESPRALRP